MHPLLWTAGLATAIVAFVLVCSAFFAGTFATYVPVTLASDRAGLVMVSGAAVKLRGVQVGRVGGIQGGVDSVRLQLELVPSQMRHIPANVEAEIKATTAFGAKFVELIPPDKPSAARLAAGAVLHSRNVTTEVNTVFQNLVGLLNKIDVAKLDAVLTALADGVRGRGDRIGQATTDTSQVLAAINPRMDTVAANFRSFKGFSDAYGAAAQDILTTLDAATTTSSTITQHAKDLDALLVNTIGFSNSAIEVLAPNKDNLIKAINGLEPTTELLQKYSPSYTCIIQGAKVYLDKGAFQNFGGNGKSDIVDGTFMLGADPYVYPDDLPIVAAKGGPGGKPGCGSLPDVAKNFPVRALVTNTGWGTGLNLRPNLGLGHPGYVDYFPVTRGTPKPPSVRYQGPPAIGPVPYPGAPPYGAPLYGPDGTPLYPGVPAPPPPPAAAANDAPSAPPAEAPPGGPRP